MWLFDIQMPKYTICQGFMVKGGIRLGLTTVEFGNTKTSCTHLYLLVPHLCVLRKQIKKIFPEYVYVFCLFPMTFDLRRLYPCPTDLHNARDTRSKKKYFRTEKS